MSAGHPASMADEQQSYAISDLPTSSPSRWTASDSHSKYQRQEDMENIPPRRLSPKKKPVLLLSGYHEQSYTHTRESEKHSPSYTMAGDSIGQLRATSGPQLPVFAGFNKRNDLLQSWEQSYQPALPAYSDLLSSRAVRSRQVSMPVRSQGESEGSDGSEVERIQMEEPEGLHYHAFEDDFKQRARQVSQPAVSGISRPSSAMRGEQSSPQRLDVPTDGSSSRPVSSHTDSPIRTFTPYSAPGSRRGSPQRHERDRAVSGRSASARATSYVLELNNLPYSQQIAPGDALGHKSLQSIVGSGASLLDTKKTIDMYRSNIKKDTGSSVQYEFAILMVNTARDATPDDGLDAAELITEAKHILQRLADRAYPFAQYYLGDGYFSGLFNKDKPDHEKALSQFIAASKHGHAEAGYRAALCYEFGWGTGKSYPKAQQFYRASASKNHPGAATRLGLACIHGDMGILPRERYREGIKWLKRAAESADFQYNTAPYELGVLHLTGDGDSVNGSGGGGVIFKDEPYAAQLFTRAAELGHAQANFLMGQAYETGLYGCPRDAALSVHFYNGAATRGHPEAMMALCAWYMIGAEPVLEKDEGEAYAWAMMAARTGYVRAEYAVGYFTEMGIGCRRDALEANVWYVRAAEQGDEKARQRLQLIRAAAAGGSTTDANGRAGEGKKKKFMGLF